MNAKPRINFNKVLEIILSISIIIAGICLIIGCFSIYYSGAEHPYTPEIVAKTFKAISVPIYICLVLVVISFIGAIINADEKKKEFLKTSETQLLKILTDKRDLTSEPELFEKILKEHHIRKIHTTIWAVITAVSAACFLTYALNFTNFHRSEINASMIKAMYVLMPCLAVVFLASVLFYLLNQKSKKREIALLKTAPLKSIDSSLEDTTVKKLRIIKLVLLVLFLGLAILGFVLGGTADVLTKAVNICTECIGLG